jgi:DNA-binding IclR family transcriptional regulator
MPSSYSVKPVQKALQVLQCIGEAGRDLTLTEICLAVHIPKTTTFRYLCTLCETGFVTRDPETDQYGLGLKLFELGHTVAENLRIREVAKPFVEALREKFNETVNLGVLDGHDIVYISVAESRHSLRMQAGLGKRDPIYSTALGKAILAFLPEAQWGRHIPSEWQLRTAHTRNSLLGLKKDLQQTRIRGFSVDNEENELGARCVGAPIFNHIGRAIAAISVSGPVSRLSEDIKPAVAAAVVQAAAEISQRLGHTSVQLSDAPSQMP